jgi:hypothetical protein
VWGDVAAPVISLNEMRLRATSHFPKETASLNRYQHTVACFRAINFLRIECLMRRLPICWLKIVNKQSALLKMSG